MGYTTGDIMKWNNKKIKENIIDFQKDNINDRINFLESQNVNSIEIEHEINIGKAYINELNDSELIIDDSNYPEYIVVQLAELEECWDSELNDYAL